MRDVFTDACSHEWRANTSVFAAEGDIICNKCFSKMTEEESDKRGRVLKGPWK